MKEKYLPIGSVVLLNGGTKKIMVSGYCMKTPDKPDAVFDYCGYVYPEGVIRSDITCVFNHDQISKIFYLGYQDVECARLLKELKDAAIELEQKKDNLYDEEPLLEENHDNQYDEQI